MNSPKYKNGTVNSELIELEEVWRLKLKASGFQDVESVDYRTHTKTKQLKFIRGRIRLKRYGGIEAFNRRKEEVFEYYRVIGLFAHHAPYDLILEKYREVLKELVFTGSPHKAIANLKSPVKYMAVWSYINRTFPKMLEFVSKLDKESLDD